LWILLLAAGFAMSACSSSSKPANTNTGGSVSTTAGTSGASTTVCEIPQNNGGDHDADNNGAPSDGDGCK
jgi:hypothetical protein